MGNAMKNLTPWITGGHVKQQTVITDFYNGALNWYRLQKNKKKQKKKKKKKKKNNNKKQKKQNKKKHGQQH